MVMAERGFLKTDLIRKCHKMCMQKIPGIFRSEMALWISIITIHDIIIIFD